MQKNLLIIDNDRKSNERISLFLEPDGFKVSVAESGRRLLKNGAGIRLTSFCLTYLCPEWTVGSFAEESEKYLPYLLL